VSPTFRLSVGSLLAAIALGAVAAYLTVRSNSPQSLADYISAICAKSFGSAPAAEAPYLAENVTAMTKMMIDMGIRPSGDVDTDFVAMMVPHHQGAIEMAQAELRYGRKEPLRRTITYFFRARKPRRLGRRGSALSLLFDVPLMIANGAPPAVGRGPQNSICAINLTTVMPDEINGSRLTAQRTASRTACCVKALCRVGPVFIPSRSQLHM
jgi:hypothetical protein